MLQRNGKQVPEEEISYMTDWLTHEAVSLIGNRQQEKPFFMYLSYNAPHTPMHAKKEDLAKYSHIKKKGRRIYAAMVDNMDANIGRLRDFLKKNQLEKNTLIIFASDNGGATTNSSDNGIYRGMKGSKWEGGHRVPCLLYWPNGKLTGGQKSELLVSTLDFMATSLDAAGEPALIKDLKLDGVSLLPLLQNEVTEEAHGVLYFRRTVAAGLRDGPWKLIRVENKDRSYTFTLFNLATDIGETVNLADKHPEKVKQLASKISIWEKGLMPPNWRNGEYWENNQRYKHRLDVIGRDAERRMP